MEVEVLFPYEPQHDDELRLTVGEVITNVVSLETGWYHGTLSNNETGVFPDNFVKVLSKEPKNATTENGIGSTPPNVQKREMGGRKCRVVFSYAPQYDDELTLCVGQTITILQEVEEGWWKGVLDGQVGMFPSNFVEDSPESEEVPAKSTESNLENINNQLNVNSDQKEIKPKPIQGMGYGVKLTDLKRDVNNRKDSDTTSSNGSPKILGSSGSSAFQPVVKSKELPKENGQVKDFRDLPHRLPPALEPKAEKVTNKTDKTRINAADKERISSLEKDRITITIGEEKSKGKQANKRENPAAAVSDATSQPPPQLPPKPVPSGKVRELAKVMFPYSAEHEDELELKVGDIITILCKELEDKGWWRGELNGHVGVFPDNFVELITVEETTKPPRPEKPSVSLAKKGSPSSSADNTPTGTLSKTDKEPPPPLPEKKVQPPPPPEKKTGVASLVSSDISDGNSTSKDQNEMRKLLKSKPSAKEEQSLSLDLDGERLTHVTQSRPKGPSRRRPPSGLFKENMKNHISADSDTLLPTPEDDLEDVESSNQINGHASSSEIHRSPSVPSLVQTSPKPPAPLTSPTSGKPIVELRNKHEGGNKDIPWLQELRLNQKKKISGVFNSEDAMTTSTGPTVSPKPIAGAPKADDRTDTKAVKPKPELSEPKAKPTEPSIPSPDYDSKSTPFLQPLTRNKPMPPTPSSMTNIEAKRASNGIDLPSVADTRKFPPITEPRKPVPSADARKLIPSAEAKESKPVVVLQKESTESSGNQIEEKVNAVYKELLPKIKALEDKLEENRKQQSHCIQMLMSELDEERKKRACMEVEIERLKKLVNPYTQV